MVEIGLNRFLVWSILNCILPLELDLKIVYLDLILFRFLNNFDWDELVFNFLLIEFPFALMDLKYGVLDCLFKDLKLSFDVFVFFRNFREFDFLRFLF